MTLKEQIEQFAKDWQVFRDAKIREKHPSHKTEEVLINFNKKFAVIYTNDTGDKAHIALVDGENKHIGAYKQGDIFMPETWNRPAKHKRGSLFADNPLSCMGPYGVKSFRELFERP